MDDGPESASCASKMAIGVFQRRLSAAGGLFLASCEVFPSQVKSAFYIILCTLMFVTFALWIIKLKASLQKLSCPTTVSTRAFRRRVPSVLVRLQGSRHPCVHFRRCSAFASGK